MRSNEDPARGPAWRIGAGPHRFVGTPPLCTGELEIINDSADRVTVRSIPVEVDAEPSGVRNVRLITRLQPGDRKRVAAQLLIDPHTPPGSYEGRIGDSVGRQPLTIRVFEKRAIQLAPSIVRLRGARGETLTHPLVIRNRGNVTETIPHAFLVHLEERAWLGRALVYALRQLGEDEGHERYLDRVVGELRATDIPPTRVTVRESGELRPGETAEVELQLTLPEKLAKGRTYVRRLPFLSTSLTLLVECDGAGPTPRRES